MFGLAPATTGAVIGFVIGAICYFWLTPLLLEWFERWTGERDDVVRSLLWTDLVFYPLGGFVIGWLFF